MSRSIVLSNGELCVALDDHGLVRDIYYPHVGLEDHVRGHYIHRIGVWVEGAFSWLGGEGWRIVISCEEDALASVITAYHERLGIELRFTDIVYNERAVFLRRVTVKNLSDRRREIKLYFGHQFEIYKSHGSDTAYYDPECHAIIHYKGRRVFLISAALDGEAFQDFATGLAGFQGHEGTHKDAEDGKLSLNPIEHGPADSVIGIYGHYAPGQERRCEYYVAAAQSIPDAHELDTYVKTKTQEHMVRTASDFWRAWVGAYEWHFKNLAPEVVALFKRSLMYVRAHVDTEGGIIASVDSDMLQYGLDTYSYVWPRDASYAAIALDNAGDTNVAQRFFTFCKEIIRKEGYLMHKYLPDRSLGSSWHPWLRNGHSELPIQEDETALVIYALGQHFTHSRDVEFLEAMYGPLVEKAAEFMIFYRDPITNLPLASYDLWEEKRGSSTFTSAAVYGALNAAADLSRILGKKDNEMRYRGVAEEIQEGILQYLWDEKLGCFIKLVERVGETMVRDETLDSSSAYGIFSFKVLPHDDARLARAWDKTVRELSHGIPAGGIARYAGDTYYRTDAESAGNPWLTTTLWYAEYLIAQAKRDTDLDHARDIFGWAAKHAQPSGVLSEQLDPRTGLQISASPLAWSHAAYVNAVILYLNKLEELGLCKECNPAP